MLSLWRYAACFFTIDNLLKHDIDRGVETDFYRAISYFFIGYIRVAACLNSNVSCWDAEHCLIYLPRARILLS